MILGCSDAEYSFKNPFNPLTTAKAITIIVIVGLIVFFNSFFNGFVSDDGLLVVKNQTIHSLTNIPILFTGSIFYNGDVLQLSGSMYRPITSSFYALLYSIFGPNASGFHIFQVFMHIANTIIIFLIFRRFFKSYISIILALLFLIHPINSETIAYIAALQDILFFFFGSLAFYLSLTMKEKLAKYIWIALLLLLSLFAKETGILFLIIILFHDYFLRRSIIKKTFSACVIVLIIYTYFRLFVGHITYNAASFAPIMNLSLTERLLNTPSVILYYISKTFLPIHLAISQQWIVSLKTITDFYIASILDVILIGVVFWLGKIIHISHNKYFKTYIFFSFWLLTGLMLHSQIFFALDGTVADRWFYFPLIGILGFIGVISEIYIKKHDIRRKYILLLVIMPALVALSVLTIMRNANFYDDLTLFSHDVLYAKESSALQAGLGVALARDKQYSEAEYHLLKSVELDPKSGSNWNNLGNRYMQSGKLLKAKEAYIMAIKNSNYYKPYQALSLYLFLYDKPELAAEFTKRSLQKFPTNGTLWQYYALIEHYLGHKDEAVNAAKKTVQYLPNDSTRMIYDRLSQNQSLEIKFVPTEKGKDLQLCPPTCN